MILIRKPLIYLRVNNVDSGSGYYHQGTEFCLSIKFTL